MPHSSLDNIAIDFFREFSRFEYALKACKFHNDKDGDAIANWRNFALTVETEFQNPTTSGFHEAIEFMIGYPPQKQIIKDGSLKWADAAPSTDSKADLVLIYVRRVRNNLFHGGKFGANWFNPNRSEKLIRYSLVILATCLDVSPDVRNAYLGMPR